MNKTITQEAINELALQYLKSIPENEGVPRHCTDDFKAGFNEAISQLTPQWIPCDHKQKLPTGNYMLQIEDELNNTVFSFHVSEAEKEREIRYYNAIAYYRVPDYVPTKDESEVQNG